MSGPVTTPTGGTVERVHAVVEMAERRLTDWLMKRRGWQSLGYIHPSALTYGAPLHHQCKRQDRIEVFGLLPQSGREVAP